MIETGDKPQTNPSKKKVSFMGYEELHDAQPPTSYWETLANLFKGNVGTGKQNIIFKFVTPKFYFYWFCKKIFKILLET